MNREMIIVLDFDEQYNELIARRVRECNVYCEVHPYTLDLEKIRQMNPKGIIFTGGPIVFIGRVSAHCKRNFRDEYSDSGYLLWFPADVYTLGGQVATAPVSEYGKTEVEVDPTSVLFEGVSPSTICWMSHTDYISQVPDGFRITAHTPVCPTAAMECAEKNLYAVQFHPEVLHTAEGMKMLSNFVQGLQMHRRLEDGFFCGQRHS